MTVKKIIVCGASGFIGKNVVLSLSNDDSYQVFGTYFLRKPEDHPNITYIQVDLTNKNQVYHALDGMDYVIQAAATTSGANEIKNNPFFHVTDNAVMNAYIFRAAAEKGVKQVVYFSCSIIYQSGEKAIEELDLDLNMEMHPNYFGPGWTKVYNEKMAEFYSRYSDTKFTIIRHSNIYGPHDKINPDKSHIFAATLIKILNTQDGKITIWGDGSDERDLLYISDLVDFIYLSLNQKENFSLYNVGSNSLISVKELAIVISKIIDKDIILEYDITKPSFKNKYRLNCEKAHSELKWEPKVNLNEGINLTIKWLKEEF